MRTQIITLGFFLTLLTIYGKEARKLDTIYANEKMNLALFFPANIHQGIVGSNNFVFSYNREKGQTLGLLKATNGEPSNLLVVTTDGNIYSYIIKYAESLDELNRFINLSDSIGHESKRESIVKVEPVKTKPKTERKKQHSNSFLEKSCAALLEQSERKNIIKRKKGLSLGIKNMVYYKDLVFVQFEIKNKSGIDFDIDYLKLALVSGNGKRKSSYQSTPLIPGYIHKMPNKTRHAGTSRFVYVIPKFTLGDNEKLELSLKELNGNRELILKRKL